VFRITDEERLEPVLGPVAAPAAENEPEPTIGLATPAEEPTWINGRRPSRRSLRDLLRMSDFLYAIRDDPHAEEPPQAASRSTHDRDAALRLTSGLHEDRGQPNLPHREKRGWARWRGPIGSLVLHLFPLLLLIDWPVTPPDEPTAIPVQLVIQPPPPEAKPAPPVPQPKPPAPPPTRGRVASEDLGDPEAKEPKRPTGDPPKPADTPAQTETTPTEAKPPEKPQQTAAVVPPLPPSKPDTPKPTPVPKPPSKPSPAAHQPPRRVEDPADLAPHRARFPGPAATRDEYLAYMHSLIRQHYNLLPAGMLGDRRGMTVIEFVVLDDGKIALLKVRRSSGYPDIDHRVAEMIEAVGRFPPLPQWFQGIAMPFEFGFPFPDALTE
jgi:TonB family protein